MIKIKELKIKKRFNLRKFFGYVEFLLGLFLLVSIFFGAYFLYNFIQYPPSLLGNEINNFLNNDNVISFNEFLFYGMIANFLVMYVGFKIIFFVLAIILIFNGLFDIRGE